MVKIKAFFRMILFGLIIFTYFLTAIPFYPLYLLAPNYWRKTLVKIVAFYCKLVCRYVFHISSEIHFETELNPNDNYLIISNHLSYIDIFVKAPFFPSCFVTSTEMKAAPLLGQVCQVAGCVFVERRSRQNLSDEIKELTLALRDGLNVAIYPESTSTNGEDVLPFKKPLFTAAVESQKPILPVCLNYRFVDGGPVTKENKDAIFWYGDKGFFPHLWSSLQTSKIHVEIRVSAPISTIDSHQNELAQQGHFVVRSHYRPII